MSKTIWKYPIPPAGNFTLDLPDDAEILDAQMQHGVACLWAKVDPEAPKHRVRFALVGTGCGDAPEHAVYIASLQFQSGNFVFHLFQIGADGPHPWGSKASDFSL